MPLRPLLFSLWLLVRCRCRAPLSNRKLRRPYSWQSVWGRGHRFAFEGSKYFAAEGQRGGKRCRCPAVGDAHAGHPKERCGVGRVGLEAGRGEVGVQIKRRRGAGKVVPEAGPPRRRRWGRRANAERARVRGWTDKAEAPKESAVEVIRYESRGAWRVAFSRNHPLCYSSSGRGSNVDNWAVRTTGAELRGVCVILVP